MNSRRTIVAFAVVTGAVLLTACDRHEESNDRAVKLEARIDSLRIEGSFQEALASAKELLDLRRLDKRSRPYEVADTQRLVSTIEFILTLPVEDQEDLARAYGMKATWNERVYKNESWAEEARAAIHEQREIFSRILGPHHPDAAISLNELDFIRWVVEDDALAGALSREALEIYRKALGPEHPNFAARLSDVGYSLYWKGDIAGADSLYRQALIVYRKALGPGHPQAGKVLIRLAEISAQQGDRDNADALMDEARKIYRETMRQCDFELAVSLDDIANCLWREGDFGGAQCLLEVASFVHPRRIELSHGMISWGPVYEFFGGPFSVQVADDPDLAWSLDGLALYLDPFEFDSTDAECVRRTALAESMRSIALDLRRKALGPEHPDLARALDEAANWTLRNENYTEAEALFREALGIKQKAFGSDHPHVAQSQSYIADCLMAREDYAGAEPLLRLALERLEKAKVPGLHGVKRGAEDLAHCLYKAGDYAGADSTYREALDNLRTGYGPDHHYVEQTLSNYARFLCRTEDFDRAEEYLTEAARVYESSRRRTGFAMDSAAYRASPYPALASARLTIGKTEDAWPAVERSLGRALADLLLAAGSRPLTTAEAASEDSLLQALTSLDGRVQALSEAFKADPNPTKIVEYQKLRKDLIELEAAWSSFQARLRKRYPLTEGQSYPLEKVQAVLDSETAILGWLNARQQEGSLGPWAYVIRQKGPVAWARLKPSEDESGPSPYEQSQRFRDQLALSGWSGHSEHPTAHAGLYHWRQRVAPISHALDRVTHLVVIPSGPMLKLPVEALVDETGTYLGDRFAISYIPSATIYTWLRERNRARERLHAHESLLVGDPPFRADQLTEMEEGQDIVALCFTPRASTVDRSVLRSVLAGDKEALNSLPRLPCTRLEVEGIAHLLPQPMILLGPMASEQELVHLAQSKKLRDFSTIHFATHALVDRYNPERSALVLSQVDLPDPLEAAAKGERIHDGLVTAKEILREWELEADLVTLSGCETALGRDGEGYVSLAHTFLQAGARSLIVSLWPVEDRATSLLMERFYENWTGRYDETRNGHKGEAMSKADALQEAKHYVRTYTDEGGERPFEHPYYWAAFILIGERE